MVINGLMKLTLLDFPGKVACTLFTAGCNMRCPFCHNAGLVTDVHAEERIPTEEIMAFLKKRKRVLEGVCVTGGEPTLQPDLLDFLAELKGIGYCVKLDTNGLRPDVLEEAVNSRLVDYVAMDVKNSKAMYAATVGREVDMQAIERSVNFLKSGAVQYEFRTTVTATFHSEQSIVEMGQWLQGAERAFLQQFVDSGNLIDGTVKGCDKATMGRYLQILRQYVPNAQVRGVDLD